jgi:Uma2 family endonuclease
MSSPTINPSHPIEIEYPDSDGERIADNTLQFDWIVTIKEGLDYLFDTDPQVFVAGDLLWYPVLGNPKIRTAPDTMVAFGRPKGPRGSYKQWEEGGIAPQVVFETVVLETRPGEMIRKFLFYNEHGVEEFYVYHLENGIVEGWLRGTSGLEEIPEMSGFTSPRLGIRFEPGEGPSNLKLIRPDGEPFMTCIELVEDIEFQRQLAARAAARWRAIDERDRADRLAARLRLEEERQGTAEEQKRAEDERQRGERLAARLRELGIDPK